VLTLKDGTRYVLDRPDTGAWFEDAWTADTPYIQTWGTPRLRRIELRNGSRLEFRADGSGIDHYTAQGVKDRSVVFERDARGRITGIYSGAALDADGNPAGPAVVTYEYDAQGNLWKVHRLVDRTDPNNPAYRTVEYEYNDPDHPHYITGIKDPRGRLPLRAEYDADGRLVALVDAEGNRTELDHDRGLLEISLDPSYYTEDSLFPGFEILCEGGIRRPRHCGGYLATDWATPVCVVDDLGRRDGGGNVDTVGLKLPFGRILPHFGHNGGGIYCTFIIVAVALDHPNGGLKFDSLCHFFLLVFVGSPGWANGSN
jgi:hypothetical protein